MSSLTNFRNLLNKQKGDYIIYGNGNSGKSALIKFILEQFKDYEYEDLTDDDLLFSFKDLDITIRHIIAHTLPKSDKFKYIYLPYNYTLTPKFRLDKLAIIDIHLSILDAEAMIC